MSLGTRRGKHHLKPRLPLLEQKAQLKTASTGCYGENSLALT